MDKFLNIFKNLSSSKVEVKITATARACEKSFIFIIFKSIWLIDSPCLHTHIRNEGSYNTPKWYNIKDWNLKMNLKAIFIEVKFTTLESNWEYYLTYWKQNDLEIKYLTECLRLF